MRGELPVSLARPDLFEAARKTFLSKMKASPILYSEFSHHGTPMTVDATAGLGFIPPELAGHGGV